MIRIVAVIEGECNSATNDILACRRKRATMIFVAKEYKYYVHTCTCTPLLVERDTWRSGWKDGQEETIPTSLSNPVTLKKRNALNGFRVERHSI
jgi:hypothetical protein